MSEIKGIISPKGEKLLAQLADERVHWKNPIMEKLDGKLFLVFIRILDNNLLEKIPEEWQNLIEPIIEAALDREWEQAADLIAIFTAEMVDLSFLDEKSEILLFNSILSLVFGLIMGKVESVRLGEA